MASVECRSELARGAILAAGDPSHRLGTKGPGVALT